jgi:hypothetical protein
LKFGGEQFPLGDNEYLLMQMRLAEWFGWTFDQIDALPFSTMTDIFAVKAAEMKRAEEKKKR